MSTVEQAVKQSETGVAENKVVGQSIFTRFLKFISSVRFGVTLLVLLGFACLVGMLVMQQNVAGFDRYFADLTPAQRLLYGRLGFFNIYHVWYFNVLLAILSLNIILASIERFPKTWLFVSKPHYTVPVRWLKEQPQTAELELSGTFNEVKDRLTANMAKSGWKKVTATEKNGKTFLFGQSGVWNRLSAYPVHVGLLTIFVGGFMTAQMGSTGQMPLSPGTSTDLMFDTVVDLDKTSEVTQKLPFTVFCTDVQQKLIKKDESISAMNTIDWITRYTITDETGTHEAMVQMNRPFDYRGYRFFQASFTPVGRARNITVTAKPASGGQPVEVTIPRDGTTSLPDGTQIKFKEFRGNFSIGTENPNEDTSNYPNPGAVLQVTQPGGQTQVAYAFGAQMASMPVAGKPVAGYTYQLTDFEKVADQHILSVQRDPGATVVYVGFIILCLALIAAFFFSHQRVWAVIESIGEKDHKIVLGGNTNRSLNAFDEKFKRFTGELTIRQ
ncbi:MAG TPA: cytochrome c biogenesis protein ResB [Pyrinomonadaceae bacterium]|nr:cytochrome c biogenesis protein ResB [Chloracidobacterium sp.]MBP9934997.1 cytochrome c biogenesis protein ResB [Pyrinomonadaceae bacterium]MBK7801377.1 cytochrome c biogenesis protein ResB [Chloracidobacterium sp.]MBK9436696.1 cytochrome c biogenesis protein ResB [Chloracidobacterium sp.]MBK9766318.1 cytochrome c biogenesis protein ResB [Chloracidobacterium sp.]